MTAVGLGQARWYSPTRLWSLLNCPASTGEPPADTSWMAPDDSEMNAGTLAHKALGAWIKSGGFHSNDPRTSLAEVVDALLPKGTGTPPPRWPVTRARLLQKAPLLAEILDYRADEQILSEVELRDHALHLRGMPDLVLLGDEIDLLDLKTQTLKHGELPEWVVFQLNLYAHLVRVNQGIHPISAKILSLNRGLIPVPISEATIQAALRAAAAARASSLDDARPGPDVCRFCARRLGCQPHWDASRSWDAPDCLEGVVSRIEAAANGLAVVQVSDAQSCAWVSGVPAASVADAKEGNHIRLVRVWQAAAAPDSDNPSWRWGASSALQLQAPELPVR